MNRRKRRRHIQHPTNPLIAVCGGQWDTIAPIDRTGDINEATCKGCVQQWRAATDGLPTHHQLAAKTEAERHAHEAPIRALRKRVSDLESRLAASELRNKQLMRETGMLRLKSEWHHLARRLEEVRGWSMNEIYRWGARTLNIALEDMHASTLDAPQLRRLCADAHDLLSVHTRKRDLTG